MGECAELVVLDLRGNSLSTLPPDLDRCTDLEFLHLGGNNISRFDKELCQALVNLRELYLYRNKIDSLPPEVRPPTIPCSPQEYPAQTTRTYRCPFANARSLLDRLGRLTCRKQKHHFRSTVVQNARVCTVVMRVVGNRAPALRCNVRNPHNSLR